MMYKSSLLEELQVVWGWRTGVAGVPGGRMWPQDPLGKNLECLAAALELDPQSSGNPRGIFSGRTSDLGQARLSLGLSSFEPLDGRGWESLPDGSLLGSRVGLGLLWDLKQIAAPL